MTFVSTVSWLVKTKQYLNFCALLHKRLNTMKMTLTLDDIQELKASNVHIKNRDTVISIINCLIEGGSDNLQVVSDYDLTLTKQHDNGYQHVTSFGKTPFTPLIRRPNTPDHPRHYRSIQRCFAPDHMLLHLQLHINH